MRRILSYLAEAPYRLLAVVTAAALADATAAHAATGSGIGGVATAFNTGLSDMGKTVLGGSVLGGLTLVGSGLIKLKTAADSQGREPFSPGLWRLGAGAGLTGLPAMANIFETTATGGNGTNVVTEGTASFN